MTSWQPPGTSLSQLTWSLVHGAVDPAGDAIGTGLLVQRGALIEEEAHGLSWIVRVGGTCRVQGYTVSLKNVISISVGSLRSLWLFANLAFLLTCGLLLVDKDTLAKAGKVAKWT